MPGDSLATSPKFLHHLRRFHGWGKYGAAYPWEHRIHKSQLRKKATLESDFQLEVAVLAQEKKVDLDAIANATRNIGRVVEVAPNKLSMDDITSNLNFAELSTQVKDLQSHKAESNAECTKGATTATPKPPPLPPSLHEWHLGH